jgi:hypothetical protein
MWIGVSVRPVAIMLTSACVAACAPLGGNGRGLPPAIEATDVEQAGGNTERILTALRADSAIGMPGPISWYAVSQAGFNYIDDRCSEYFNVLFQLNRRREGIKAGLSAFGQTTNAILATTGASAISMAVVAQAFGLASSVTDIVAGTYLYQLPPATTESFVKELQFAFRTGAKEAAKQNEIRGPDDAYHLIQQYLSLCLPPTIEARLVEHIGAVNPQVEQSGPNVSVRVGMAGTLPLQTIISSRERLAPLPTRTSLPGALNANETRLADTEVRDIQLALCLVPNGKLGDETRRAIVQFFEGYGSPRADITSKGILPRDMDALNQAIDSSHGKDCATRGIKHGPSEVGRLLH